MVIVFPNGAVNGNGQRVSDAGKDPLIFELMTVIIPYMEAKYRVSKLPDDRAIAGLSLGGHQAIFIGLTHAQQFRYVGAFSSGLPNQQAFEEKYGPTLAQEAARLKLIWIGYETRDPARPKAESEKKMFDRCGVKYQSQETPGGHVWANWRLHLSQFAPLLFR